MTTTIFDQAHPKITEITFAFLNLHHHAKNQFLPSIHSWDTANFKVTWPDWPHTFLAMPIQKFLDQLLIYVNLYQHAKKQAISLICFGDMVEQKILQPDWLRTFWPISQEPEFSQIWDLCRNTANNTNFHYRVTSVKINDKIFQYIQKTLFLAHFLPIFPILGAKKFFWKIWLCHTQLHMGF